jgi:thiamine-phosphate pyrophosphorylase
VLSSLYPILNLRSAEEPELARVRALGLDLARSGVSLLQLRAKDVGAGVFTELAVWCVEELGRLGCRVLINDRVDVAMACGAAGVHLGDEDIPVAVARGLLGPAAIIGYSTHSVGEIAVAPIEADYLAFGPIFESPTKSGVRDARGLDLLAEACHATSRPVVAIGGVTLASAGELWEAGAASGAVIAEVERSTNIAALVRAWNDSRRSPALH